MQKNPTSVRIGGIPSLTLWAAAGASKRGVLPATYYGVMELSRKTLDRVGIFIVKCTHILASAGAGLRAEVGNDKAWIPLVV